MGRIGRLAAACALIGSLSSCILTPGRFTSTLDIHKDRSFAFTYVGEVIAPPPSAATAIGEGADKDEGAASPGDKSAKPESPADRARMVALADTLSKEYGFRSVRYLGRYHFAIDYAIAGRLTHAFVFPFNVDGEVIIPFIAIELRGADRVRMKAPGYAADAGKGGDMAEAMGGLGGPANRPASSELDGRFTLTTDAEIISQNQENGVVILPDGRKRIIWTATPRTKDAPVASLKLDALP